jgi:predicted DNA-binding antitoxin AbrB/MazE fold protein
MQQQRCEAVFENGVLRPIGNLQLAKGESASLNFLKVAQPYSLYIGVINLRGAKCPTKLNNNLDNEYSKLGILPSPLASPLLLRETLRVRLWRRPLGEGRRLGNFEQDFPNRQTYCRILFKP